MKESWANNRERGHYRPTPQIGNWCTVSFQPLKLWEAVAQCIYLSFYPISAADTFKPLLLWIPAAAVALQQFLQDHRQLFQTRPLRKMNTQLVIIEAKQFKQPVSTGGNQSQGEKAAPQHSILQPYPGLWLPAADHSPTAPPLQMQPSSELCRKSTCQFLNTHDFFFSASWAFQPHQELKNFHMKGKNAHPRQKVPSKTLMFLL